MKNFGLGMSLLILVLLCGVTNVSAITIDNAGFETELGSSSWVQYALNGGSVDRVESSILGDGTTALPQDGDFMIMLSIGDAGGGDTGVYQETSWIAGDTISFSWLFDSGQGVPDVSDYSGYFEIGGIGGWYEVTPLAWSDDVGYDTNTGWQTSEYTFASDGAGYIQFAISTFGLVSNNSFLLVDNITITSAPAPEPSTIMLFGLGILGLTGINRNKK